MNRTLILMFAKKPKFEKGIIDQPTKLKKKVNMQNECFFSLD